MVQLSDVPNLKVAELKLELETRGLPTKGLKKDLSERLEDAIRSESSGSETHQAPLPASVNEPAPHVAHHPVASIDVALPTPTLRAPSPVLSAHQQPIAPQIKEAGRDPQVTITPAEVRDQVMGDETGDLGQKMAKAEEEGMKEREEEGEKRVKEMEVEEKPKHQDNVKNQEQEDSQTEDASAKKLDRELLDEKVPVQPSSETEAVQVTQNDTTTAAGATVQTKIDAAVSAAELKDEGDDVIMEKSKTAEESLSAGEKRKREEPTDVDEQTEELVDKKSRVELPVPESLSHVLYHPTRSLYINGLKRPLQNPDLKEYLEESGPLDGESAQGGMWTNGVKTHCFCTYLDESSAIAAATRIHNSVFPPDHGASLHVEFIPETLVSTFITDEKKAWMDGRQKLTVEIARVPSGEGHDGSDVSFTLVPDAAGNGKQNNFVGKASIGAGSSTNVLSTSAPRIPLAGQPGVMGIGGVPVRVRGQARNMPMNQIQSQITANPSIASGPGTHPDRAGLGPKTQDPRSKYRKTQTRPVLFWRENPKYA